MSSNTMNTAHLEKIIHETKKKAIGTVIWLHGLGADGHDFADIVPQLNLPDHLPIRFIFPHAPIRPVTINANMHMRAWYDIYSLSDLQKEDQTGIIQTETAIHTLIHQEIEHGIRSEYIMLAGFSQGGAMALFCGLRYAQPLAGILALSTYLPLLSLATDSAHQANRKTPIFMAHGRFDPVLPITLGKNSYDQLKQLGHPIEWHEYPMAHAVCQAEIRAIGHWLTEKFSKLL
jgi:phospholipase/carboxylesterase